MLKSNLCDYSDAYVLVKGNIVVSKSSAAGESTNNAYKKAIFKNCTPFTDCMSEINYIEVDNANGIDVVTRMYKLIEYSYIYSKTSGSL